MATASQEYYTSVVSLMPESTISLEPPPPVEHGENTSGLKSETRLESRQSFEVQRQEQETELKYYETLTNPQPFDELYGSLLKMSYEIACGQKKADTESDSNTDTDRDEGEGVQDQLPPVPYKKTKQETDLLNGPSPLTVNTACSISPSVPVHLQPTTSVTPTSVTPTPTQEVRTLSATGLSSAYNASNTAKACARDPVVGGTTPSILTLLSSVELAPAPSPTPSSSPGLSAAPDRQPVPCTTFFNVSTTPTQAAGSYVLAMPSGAGTILYLPATLSDRGPNVQLSDSVPNVQLCASVPNVQLSDSVPNVQLSNNVPNVQLCASVPNVQLSNSVPNVQLSNRGPNIQLSNRSQNVPISATFPEAQLSVKVPELTSSSHVPVAGYRRVLVAPRAIPSDLEAMARDDPWVVCTEVQITSPSTVSCVSEKSVSTPSTLDTRGKHTEPSTGPGAARPDDPTTCSLLDAAHGQIEDEEPETHNMKERRRRARIKDACELMRRLVPGMSEKTDKATVLEFSARYIYFLKGFVGGIYDKDFLVKYSPY